MFLMSSFRTLILSPNPLAFIDIFNNSQAFFCISIPVICFPLPSLQSKSGIVPQPVPMSSISLPLFALQKFESKIVSVLNLYSSDIKILIPIPRLSHLIPFITILQLPSKIQHKNKALERALLFLKQ